MSTTSPAAATALDLAEVANADYVIPNETEAEALSGMPVRTLEDARNCAQKLLDGGLRRVIVTLGANGALCAGADGSRHIPPYKVNPVDTTGAGDAFVGGFAAGLVRHRGDLVAAARLGNAAGALAVTKFGTAPAMPTQREIAALLRRRA